MSGHHRQKGIRVHDASEDQAIRSLTPPAARRLVTVEVVRRQMLGVVPARPWPFNVVTRTVMTALDLQALTELVKYERNQMNNAAMRLLSLKREKYEADENSDEWERRRGPWQVESNAFLESFLIHFRNLLEFLAPLSPRKTTVTAAQFLDRDHGDKLDAPTSYRKDIHRRLAHISSERLEVDDRNKPWPTLRMADSMERAWQQFIDELRSKHSERVPWFENEQRTRLPSVSSFTGEGLQRVVTSSTQTVGPVDVTQGTPDWLLRKPED